MEPIGQRIRMWRRRRGMSQAVLAGLAGLSQGHVSKIENGEHPLDRKSMQVAVANALNISVAQLLGVRCDPENPARLGATAHVPAVQAAIVEIAYGERRRPRRGMDALREVVRSTTDLRNDADYAALTPLMADLLLDLNGHGAEMAPEMVEAVYTLTLVLHAIGHESLAREAAVLGVRAAEERGELAWLGHAKFCLIGTFPPETAALGTRVAARTAGEIQQSTDRSTLDSYGRLHLLAAMHAATALRADEADSHLAEASDVARSLGEPARYGERSAGVAGAWFGPTNVELWRVAVAAELSRPGEAVSIANRIDLSRIPVPHRHVYLHIDLARALASSRSRDREAMMALARGERAAPQHFRCNPVATNLVGTLITRARRRADVAEMTGLARRLGLDPL